MPTSLAPTPTPSRTLRWVAAILILVSGAVHLVLWSGEYKEVKIVGALFLLNVAAVVIAVALVVRPLGIFALGGMVLSAVTLIAFILSRTTGLFGFSEHEFEGSAILAAVVEVGAIVVLALWYRATRPKRGAPAVVGERHEPPATEPTSP